MDTDPTEFDTICYYQILGLILERCLSELETSVDQNHGLDHNRGTNVPQLPNHDAEHVRR